MLGKNNTFFLVIPKSSDPELIKKVIKNNVPDISEKNIDSVLSHIDKIYCGLLTSRKTTTYQISASCNVPGSFIPNIFSRKKGFSKSVYSVGSYNFDIYNNEAINISFPDSSVFCLGRDIPQMLDSYVQIKKNGFLITEDENLSEENSDFLNSSENEIRFFANKPQSFLSMLTGVNLDMKLLWVKGQIYLDDNIKETYLLDLDFNFINEKYVKAGKALLTLAFGLSETTNELSTPTELRIEGIRLNKNNVLKLLTL